MTAISSKVAQTATLEAETIKSFVLEQATIFMSNRRSNPKKLMQGFVNLDRNSDPIKLSMAGPNDLKLHIMTIVEIAK